MSLGTFPAEFLSPTLSTLARVLGLENDNSEIHFNADIERVMALKRQLGVLQQRSYVDQKKIYQPFAAKYLPQLYQKWYTAEESLSSYAVMLNVMSDDIYFARYMNLQETNGMMERHITRLIDNLKDIERYGETHIAELCQFTSTLLVLRGTGTVTEEQKEKLLPALRTWMTRYAGRFAAETAGRVHGALTGDMEITLLSKMMKQQLEKDLNECGYPECSVVRSQTGEGLKQCGRCKVTRYCGPEHQKLSWPTHKRTCYASSF
ncbi:hypothetical protein FRC03_011528 [Tulasnella sp. 419]|nr:hypothetical protein FRC02_008499 [Tulasnella sp. 418]KAG8966693.1 hypothetical protein FRC03_011528 [Tulasnella sp. 419]